MRRHLWREVRRQLREARGIGSVAVFLLAVGGAWALLATSFLQWGRAGLARVASEEVVVAILLEDADSSAVARATAERFPDTRSAYLSPQVLAETVAGWSGGSWPEGLLPGALSVTVAAAKAPEVKEYLRGQPGVGVVMSSQEWVGPALGGFSVALRLAGFVAFVFVFAFASLVVLVVRLLVLSHADEIAIMRLIGAHEEDIRAPYLVASTLLGVLGGALAVGLGELARLVLASWVSLPQFPALRVVLTCLGGGLAGWLGALVGVRSLPGEL